MSIADKLTYLQTTKQLLKTEINKINNVLDDNSTFRSYPQELFNGYLDILNNGTDTLWSNLEKVSQISTEAVLENVENAPMKIELSGNTSQDGTPTPEHPQQVKVVKGENVVSISGENQSDKTDYPIDLTVGNLFDKDNVNVLNCYIDATAKSLRGATADRTIWIEVEPNTTYQVTKMVTDPTTKARFRLGTSNLQPESGGALTQAVRDDTATELSITTGSVDNYLVVFCYTSGSTTTLEEILDSLVITGGSSTYEEMCKIGNYKDYFYKDSGKWYVHKAVRKIVLDGTRNWIYQDEATTPTPRTVIRLQNVGLGSDLYFSSHFIKDSSSSNRIVLLTAGGSTLYLSLDNTLSGIDTTDDSSIKVTKIKTWLSNNNVTLYYVLATPVEEEITNATLIEQLEAISKAKSIKDKTYVTQTNDELPFVLDVEAIKKYEVA